MKKLLMLGTSYGTCEMLRYAKSIGVHTIVTDYNEPEHSLGKQISDEYWMINTGDLDTLEAKCREEGVNAVVCGISEFNLADVHGVVPPSRSAVLLHARGMALLPR